MTDDTITVTLPIEYDDDVWHVGAWGFYEVDWRDIAPDVNHPLHPLAVGVVAHIDAVKTREAEAWRNAKPGEGWVLTVDGVEGRYLCRAGGSAYFVSESVSMRVLHPFVYPDDATRITAARLAWPLDGE